MLSRYEAIDSDECKPYLNLGSIGPDLSYYGSQWEGVKNLLHSKEPNQFPLTLIELTWKDTRWEELEWKD